LVVEEHFRARPTTLRVIAATTTLAMGVNTPAEAVVVAGLDHPGDNPYSIAEYKNIIGRAGRLGFSDKGTSCVITMDRSTEHGVWTKYVLGRPEDLESQFLSDGTDPRSLILRVLVAAQRTAQEGLGADDIVEFLENSFGVFQKKQRTQGWQWDQGELIAALSELDKHSLVELDDKSRYRLTELGRLSGEAGVEVESITRTIQHLLQTNGRALSPKADDYHDQSWI
jgi:helicase